MSYSYCVARVQLECPRSFGLQVPRTNTPYPIYYQRWFTCIRRVAIAVMSNFMIRHLLVRPRKADERMRVTPISLMPIACGKGQIGCGWSNQTIADSRIVGLIRTTHLTYQHSNLCCAIVWSRHATFYHALRPGHARGDECYQQPAV
jgi:hypothetical protein